jgi:hypothetical protein
MIKTHLQKQDDVGQKKKKWRGGKKGERNKEKIKVVVTVVEVVMVMTTKIALIISLNSAHETLVIFSYMLKTVINPLVPESNATSIGPAARNFSWLF